VANMLAVRIPDPACAVPVYGGQLDAEDVPNIKAPLLLHYAGLDERVNAGWPAYEAASRANGIQCMRDTQTIRSATHPTGPASKPFSREDSRRVRQRRPAEPARPRR
jgi:dienelactone hydrolase